MSLSSTESAELQTLATNELADNVPCIHALAALYARFGTHTAREITDVIGPATSSGTFGYFGGFIHKSDSQGFRAELSDPNINNPQTGHFFSFVVWSQNGISEFEAGAALGHEYVSDLIVGHELAQLASGAPSAREFRDFITAQPLDPNGTLDYSSLDSAFSAHGWSDDITPTSHYDASIPFLIEVSDDPFYTGNSIQDLRCTVAGFHFGRLIRYGLFPNGAGAAAWLERNVLDGPCRVSVTGTTPVLSVTAPTP